MLYLVLADLVLLVHLLFVLFVVGGGLFALRWPWIAWLHLPAAAWGAAIEFMGWICPLTPLENRLLDRSGESAYEGDFIGHYLVSLLYPNELTRSLQIVLGFLVVLVNAGAYGWLFFSRRRV
ncbi:MAG TPA: DUF2784 domain-containing protein [Nitrospiraceae bacterium]|nr:DUF2784 domain-containing protein [Nitrospiraceae bacterium]